MKMREKAWSNSYHKTSTPYVLIKYKYLLSVQLGALTDTGTSKWGKFSTPNTAAYSACSTWAFIFLQKQELMTLADRYCNSLPYLKPQSHQRQVQLLGCVGETEMRTKFWPKLDLAKHISQDVFS